MKGSEYVLDANIIMSLLISGKSSSIKLLQLYTYYVPDFIFDEIDEPNKLIQAKSKLTAGAMSQYTIRVMQEIVVVPRFIISEHKLEQAEFYCQSIDENDVAYVALSI